MILKLYSLLCYSLGLLRQGPRRGGWWWNMWAHFNHLPAERLWFYIGFIRENKAQEMIYLENDFFLKLL